MITVRDVSYAYGKRRALDGVSFTFEDASVGRPRILGLLGPNGGGKSTLLQIIATLRRPLTGSVSLLGKDTVKNENDARRLLGMVFQTRSLDPLLTVRENLRHAGHLQGLSGKTLDARIETLLGQFRLSDRQNDRAKTLSGGLARRVELAKALLHSPQVLLLDEPSNGLDPEARRDLWNALSSLDMTIVVATHLVEEAERCERLAFVSKGKLVAYDTPEALKSRAGDDVLVLEARGNESLPTLAGGVMKNGLLHVPTKDARALMLEVLDKYGSVLASLKMQRPTIEDVFIRVTGETL
jgi:ABC-2 type transport system ATP-binding protein